LTSVKESIVSDNLATRIRVNQKKLFAELKPHYDFIVCGSGSSGSVWHGDWPRTPMSAFSRRGHSVTDDDQRLAHGISLLGA
jgi:hypothetical protein